MSAPPETMHEQVLEQRAQHYRAALVALYAGARRHRNLAEEFTGAARELESLAAFVEQMVRSCLGADGLPPSCALCDGAPISEGDTGGPVVCSECDGSGVEVGPAAPAA